MKNEANLDYINRLAGDDKEFRDQFIHILKTEFPGEKEAYLQALQRKEYRTASEWVHKIKHKLSILNLHQGHTLAGLHEEELRDGKTDKASGFLDTLNYIEEYLKRLTA
ncbi:Hpt domain-containing protein [Robiginitalea sp. IMCC43444]|uniref:Hpt domain-containing protein n=1 Tax=Robiginitalea sp. IMCC43444 TaxID=3459121 RepID=UPI00404325C8